MGGSISLFVCSEWYAQFNKTGNIELLASAGLRGKGTIQKNLKGDVKEGIQVYRKMFEALIRYIISVYSKQVNRK